MKPIKRLARLCAIFVVSLSGAGQALGDVTSDDLTITNTAPASGSTIYGPGEGQQLALGNSIAIMYEYEIYSQDAGKIVQRALLQDGNEAYNQYWTMSSVTKGKGYRQHALTVLCKGRNQADTRVKGIRYQLWASGSEDLLVQKVASVDYTFKCLQAAVGDYGQTAEADSKALKVMAPKLGVSRIAVHPVPLKAGTPVNLEIAFENKGNKASGPDAKYKLACAVVQGGPECPAPSGDRAIGKSIEPGQTGSVILMGAKPAAAGEYRVSVAVPPDQPGRPYSITLKVAPVNTGPKVQPPDQRPQVRPTAPSQPKSDDGKPRLVPRQ